MVNALRWIEAWHTSEKIGFFLACFSHDLASEIAQIVTEFRVLNRKLLIETFFLSEPSLEHVDFLAKFIIFKLVLVCFASDFLISLILEFSEFSLFCVFDFLNYFVRLIQLGSQVFYQTILVVLQIFGVIFEVVHKTAKSGVFLGE